MDKKFLKSAKKGKIFETLGKNVQNLKIFKKGLVIAYNYQSYYIIILQKRP